MEYTIELVLLLFGAALAAGWVDSIAGGGGLITVPVLLLAGLNPAAAVATNKLQAVGGSFTAASHFVSKGHVELRPLVLTIALTFVGSVTGGWLVLVINPESLEAVLPILLMGLGLFTLFSKQISDQAREPRMGLVTYALIFAPLLGFYDGFFGPGTGSFMALSLVSFRGMAMTAATGQAKVMNFTSNFAALLYFLFFGSLELGAGAIMIIGQVLGASIGARMAIKGGAKLIRPLVVAVCFVMSLRLLGVL